MPSRLQPLSEIPSQDNSNQQQQPSREGSSFRRYAMHQDDIKEALNCIAFVIIFTVGFVLIWAAGGTP